MFDRYPEAENAADEILYRFSFFSDLWDNTHEFFDPINWDVTAAKLDAGYPQCTCLSYCNWATEQDKHDLKAIDWLDKQFNESLE